MQAKYRVLALGAAVTAAAAPLTAATAAGAPSRARCTGTAATAGTIQDDRLRSADGAHRALHEILVRCGMKGTKYCRFADGGDPVAKFQTLAKRLRAKPVTVDGQKITYADFIGAMLGALYGAGG